MKSIYESYCNYFLPCTSQSSNYLLACSELQSLELKRKNESQINKVCWGEHSDGKKRYMSKSDLVIIYFDGYRFLLCCSERSLGVGKQYMQLQSCCRTFHIHVGLGSCCYPSYLNVNSKLHYTQ